MALGCGRGSTQTEWNDHPDQANERKLSTRSSGSFLEGNRLSLQSAAADSSGEYSHTSSRSSCEAVFTSGLLGKPHSFRAFSSEAESKASDEASSEIESKASEEASAEVEVADEVSSEEDEVEDTSEGAEPRGKKGRRVRKKGETETVRTLWSKLSRLPKQNGDPVVAELAKWKKDGNKLSKGEVVALIRRMKKQARFKQALVVSGGDCGCVV